MLRENDLRCIRERAKEDSAFIPGQSELDRDALLAEVGRLSEESAVMKEQLAAAADRCEAWKSLAACLEQMLACCRTGREPGGKLMGEVRRLKERLGR